MNSLRKTTSLIITFSFLIMTYTGIILFIAPKGWKFLGLDKGQYVALHITFMVLFTIGILIHLYLNYRPLVSYFKNKARSFSLLTKEFMIALTLNVFFIVGTLYHWTPFEQFLDFGKAIKSSLEQKKDQTPYAHAELSTIEELAQKTGKNPDAIVQKLSSYGLKEVTIQQSIASIAKTNGKSPLELFEMIESKTILQGEKK